MTRLEELTPGAVVRGVVPGEAVTVVASRWAGSRSVVLTFRTDAGRVDEQIVYRTQESELTLDGRGSAWSFDGDGRCSGWSLRLADPARLPVRSPARGAPQPDRAAAASDQRGLRGDAAAAAAAVPARRRSRRGQDDHGRALHQGADAARRPAPVPDRRAWRAGRAVAGRAAREVRARVLDPDSRADRGRAHRRPVRRAQPADRAAGPAVAQRRARRASRRDRWDLVVVDEAHRMAAHYFGNEVKETKRYQLGKVLGGTPGTSC